MDKCKVLIFRGRIRGGESGTHDYVLDGDCEDFTGVVEISQIESPHTLTMKVGGRRFEINLRYWDGSRYISFNPPRIDVLEKVSLSLDGQKVVAIQIMKTDIVVNRFLFPQEPFRHLSKRYIFSDMPYPPEKDPSHSPMLG